MKIRYEMQTSMGRAKRLFSLSTNPTARTEGNKALSTALAVIFIVLALLVASRAGVLAQVIQVVSFLAAHLATG